MRLLTLEQVLILHKKLIAQSGGADGITVYKLFCTQKPNKYKMLC